MFEITDEVCKEILQCTQWKHFKFESKTLLPFTEGRKGLLGQHFILNIKLHGCPQTVSLFVKKSISSKEENFYRCVVPYFVNHQIYELSKVTPHVYAIREYVNDRGMECRMLALENLMENGYKILDVHDTFDLKIVLRTLESIASFHSVGILYDLKNCKEIEEGTMFDELRKDYRNKFTLLNANFVNLEENYYCDENAKYVNATTNTISTQLHYFENEREIEFDEETLRAYVTTLWSRMKEFVQPSMEYRNTMCHGDLWQANFMYSFDEDGSVKNCTILDYNMMRYCPPAQDVMAFLYVTTDREFRSKNTVTCLDHYYKHLAEIIKRHNYNPNHVLCKEEFIMSCHYYKPFAIMQAMSYSHVTYLTQKLYNDHLNDDRVRANFLRKNRSAVFLKCCETDPDYRKKQLECLLDINDYYKTQL